ncbi:hypothetical protein QCA50_008906 [Cerrena zonata]|uniref:Uncharacterized protein n=1 Tax=Cerrena zonata TaxID=2478898 RepID=A0AAW0G2G6_9APHY
MQSVTHAQNLRRWWNEQVFGCPTQCAGANTSTSSSRKALQAQSKAKRVVASDV